MFGVIVQICLTNNNQPEVYDSYMCIDIYVCAKFSLYYVIYFYSDEVGNIRPLINN